MVKIILRKRCTSSEHDGPNPLPLAEFGRDRYSPDGLTAACRVCINRRAARSRRTIRDPVFDHYGRFCACCGTTENLTIDHVNGGGDEHRTELFGDPRASLQMYRWLVAQGFPPGFQVLCGPCNASKRGGVACRLHHSAEGAKYCTHPDHEGPNPLRLREFSQVNGKPDDRLSWCLACCRRLITRAE